MLPFQVLGDNSQSVQSPDIADGVAALVGGAVDGVGRAGTALVVREGSVRFQGMADREIQKLIIEGGDLHFTGLLSSECRFLFISGAQELLKQEIRSHRQLEECWASTSRALPLQLTNKQANKQTNRGQSKHSPFLSAHTMLKLTWLDAPASVVFSTEEGCTCAISAYPFCRTGTTKGFSTLTS